MVTKLAFTLFRLLSLLWPSLFRSKTCSFVPKISFWTLSRNVRSFQNEAQTELFCKLGVEYTLQWKLLGKKVITRIFWLHRTKLRQLVHAHYGEWYEARFDSVKVCIMFLRFVTWCTAAMYKSGRVCKAAGLPRWQVRCMNWTGLSWSEYA